MFQRGTRHGVFANEREFILLLRSCNRLRLSKLYSCRPSTPQDTLEMMTHLSYFFAHALCERFPSNDNRFQALDPQLEIPAALHPASSQSVSPADQGSSRTHIKTDSQATIRGPTHSTMMVGVVRRLSRAIHLLLD
jgi:hypothetical protein